MTGEPTTKSLVKGINLEGKNNSTVEKELLSWYVHPNKLLTSGMK